MAPRASRNHGGTCACAATRRSTSPSGSRWANARCATRPTCCRHRRRTWPRCTRWRCAATTGWSARTSPSASRMRCSCAARCRSPGSTRPSSTASSARSTATRHRAGLPSAVPVARAAGVRQQVRLILPIPPAGRAQYWCRVGGLFGEVVSPTRCTPPSRSRTDRRGSRDWCGCRPPMSCRSIESPPSASAAERVRWAA